MSATYYQSEACTRFFTFLGVPPSQGGLLARPYEGSGWLRGSLTLRLAFGETALRAPSASLTQGGASATGAGAT